MGSINFEFTSDYDEKKHIATDDACRFVDSIAFLGSERVGIVDEI